MIVIDTSDMCIRNAAFKLHIGHAGILDTRVVHETIVSATKKENTSFDCIINAIHSLVSTQKNSEDMIQEIPFGSVYSPKGAITLSCLAKLGIDVNVLLTSDTMFVPLVIGFEKEDILKNNEVVITVQEFCKVITVTLIDYYDASMLELSMHMDLIPAKQFIDNVPDVSSITSVGLIAPAIVHGDIDTNSNKTIDNWGVINNRWSGWFTAYYKNQEDIISDVSLAENEIFIAICCS